MFSLQYITYYYERRELNKPNFQQLLNDPSSSRIISKIRILIFIDSSPVYKNLGLGWNHYENSEDYTISLLITRLFHYSFLIPNSQILITSSKEDAFIDEEIKNSLKSSWL